MSATPVIETQDLTRDFKTTRAVDELNLSITSGELFGLVGPDGATHHGVFDISYMRGIPNMTVAAPMDVIELRNMMYTAQLGKYGPFSIRYPRGKGNTTEWKKPFRELKPGVARKLSDGTDLAILSIGFAGNLVQEAIQKLKSSRVSIAHYDMRYVKPLDEKCLHEVFKHFDKVITIEDGALTGGFGSAVIEFMCDHAYSAEVKRLGIPDNFIEHGTQEQLYRECHFDPDSIITAISQMLKPGLLFSVG